MTAEFISHSLEETSQKAADFVASLTTPTSTQATVIGLSGDLGSGKTTFVQDIAKTLGIVETVTSPTFVIEKIYKLKHPLFDHLIHIDAYRLEKGEELLHLGWKEIIENPQNIIFIEWPEKVQEILPKDTKMITFKFIDEATRKINFE